MLKFALSLAVSFSSPAVAQDEEGCYNRLTQDINCNVIDESDEELLCAAVAKFAEMGFPLDTENLGDIARVAADKKGARDPKTGKPYVCGEGFVRGMLKRSKARGRDLRKYKSSALDPQRAAAATPKARDSLLRFAPPSRL